MVAPGLRAARQGCGGRQSAKKGQNQGIRAVGRGARAGQGGWGSGAAAGWHGAGHYCGGGSRLSIRPHSLLARAPLPLKRSEQVPSTTPLKTGFELEARLQGAAPGLGGAGWRRQMQLGVPCCMACLPVLISPRCPVLWRIRGQGGNRLGTRKSGAGGGQIWMWRCPAF